MQGTDKDRFMLTSRSAARQRFQIGGIGTLIRKQSPVYRASAQIALNALRRQSR